MKEVVYIDSQLKISKSVLVDVHHHFDYGYNEGTTDHFVVIVGKGCENGNVFYNFYDVGTANLNKGTSVNNKLFLQKDNTLKGETVYNNTTYTVSQVRKNN